MWKVRPWKIKYLTEQEKMDQFYTLFLIKSCPWTSQSLRFGANSSGHCNGQPAPDFQNQRASAIDQWTTSTHVHFSNTTARNVDFVTVNSALIKLHAYIYDHKGFPSFVISAYICQCAYVHIQHQVPCDSTLDVYASNHSPAENTIQQLGHIFKNPC